MSAPRPDRDVITQAQIQEHRFKTAYEAVEALHAPWLMPKGTDSFSSPTQVLVYLDNTRLGGIDKLRELSTVSFSYIRYYDGMAASARWGMDHGQGVIYISSRP